jgi:translation initiation factor 3 subunit B
MGKNKVKHIVTLEKRPANYLFWSPAGRFIVLAGLRNLNGTLEFYNVQDKETMGTVEHDMATNIEWDPTGRYVTTYVSQWSEMLENGFMIWSFNSEKLASEMKSKLFQFLWRPRPPTLLSKEQEKDIQGKFKEYSEKYKREDAETRAKAKAEKDKQRKEMRGELDKVMAARIKDWEAGREARFALTGVPDEPTVDDFITIEQVVEEVLEVTEEVVPDNE